MLYKSTLPTEVRLHWRRSVLSSARSAARRFGYERSDTSWQAIADDPDIQRGQRCGGQLPAPARWWKALVAAGKHVLCEKPLSDNAGGCPRDGRRRPQRRRPVGARIGFTFRRAQASPRSAELVTSGALGRVLHVDVRYWCDYAERSEGPISWRYKGGPWFRRARRHRQPSPRTWPSSSAAMYTGSQRRADSRPQSPNAPVPLGAVDGARPGCGQRRSTRRSRTTTTRLQRQVLRTGVGVVQVSRVAAGHPERSALGGLPATAALRSGSRSVPQSSISC